MAQAAAADPVAQALLQHERVRKSTDLPFFHGIKDKDTIDPQDFIQRFETASNIARWVPVPANPGDPVDTTQKCEQFYMLLRSKALDWWKSLADIPDFNYNDWNAIRPEFIASYCPRFTARTACLSFGDLVQQTNEPVHDFYLRVSRAYQLLKETRFPEVTQRRLATPDLQEAQGRLARVTRGMDAAKIEGVEDMGRYVIQQLFTAGLNEDIRIKTMEANARTLHDAYKRALIVETIIKDKRGSKPLITQISAPDENNDIYEEDEDDLELLEQVNAIRTNSGKPPIRFSQFKPSSQIQVACRYCKIKGHFQKDCRKRKADRAPMVDQFGKPFQNRSYNSRPSNNRRIYSIHDGNDDYDDEDNSQVNAIDAAQFYGINSIRLNDDPTNHLNSSQMF